ncbi:MAG: MoaD/ThiS family protein [Thermoproteota archaeon]|jgi:molybdopterin converting factor small subunit
MAKVEVFIPSSIRKDKNASKVQVEASNLRELIEELDKNKIVEKERLLDNKGEIKRLINIYVNGKIERNLDLELNDGDEVSFIPIVAGG